MVTCSRLRIRAIAIIAFAAASSAPALAQQTGIASQYSGLGTTASGRSYSSSDLVAAHRTLPFGTRVRVDNLKNGRSVTVRIVDRGPFIGGRIIDLSTGAASQIGFSGLASVRVSVLGRGGDDGETSYASNRRSRRDAIVASNDDDARPARRASARTRLASYDDDRPARRTRGRAQLVASYDDDEKPARRTRVAVYNSDDDDVGVRRYGRRVRVASYDDDQQRRSSYRRSMRQQRQNSNDND